MSGTHSVRLSALVRLGASCLTGLLPSPASTGWSYQDRSRERQVDSQDAEQSHCSAQSVLVAVRSCPSASRGVGSGLFSFRFETLTCWTTTGRPHFSSSSR